jgi:quinol monooxygenase YgiN
MSLRLVAQPGDARSLSVALRAVMAQAQNNRHCLSCYVSTDVAAADTIHYVEEWTTDEALREQMRSDRFQWLIGLMEAAAEPPQFHVQVVCESRGLEYLETARGGRTS